MQNRTLRELQQQKRAPNKLNELLGGMELKTPGQRCSQNNDISIEGNDSYDEAKCLNFSTNCKLASRIVHLELAGV